MKTLLFAAALVAHGIITSGTIQSQSRPADDVRITRAIFGAASRSADVTPVVVRLAQPGLPEFYSAPKWLEIDPASGQTKSLVVFYEYRGEPHVLTTTELAAISHAILIEHADTAARLRPIATGLSNRVIVLQAYYGQGRNFQDVTTRASQLFRQTDGSIVLSDSAMMLPATTVRETLIVTYLYRGTRNTWSAYSGARVSAEALVTYAESGGQTRRYSNVPPTWLAAADSAREAGADPRLGRATRRELAINEMLKAIARLEAIPASDRSEGATTAIAATKKALVDAQVNIGYPYPAAGSPRPQVPNTSTAAHLSSATRSLTTALNELNGVANPGRGRGAAASMARILASINEALAALR